MNSAYLAISYICNQKCSFCPCTKEEKKFKYMDFQEVKDSVFRLKEELDNQSSLGFANLF